MKKISVLLILFISGCGFVRQPTIPVIPIISDTSMEDRAGLIEETISTAPFVGADQEFVTSRAVPYIFTIKNVDQKWQTSTIHLSYPVMEYSAQPFLADAFNAAVRKKIEDETADFLLLAETAAGSDEAPVPVGSYGNDMQIFVWPRFGSSSLVSTEFVISSYYGGAAHPNTITYSFNFDLGKKKELLLSDLFVPKTQYVTQLSEFAIADLKTRAREDMLVDFEWIQAGAGPKIENFHTVLIGPDGLTIRFDAYQVDAYAAGSYEVFIPYEKLTGITVRDSL